MCMYGYVYKYSYIVGSAANLRECMIMYVCKYSYFSCHQAARGMVVALQASVSIYVCMGMCVNTNYMFRSKNQQDVCMN